MTVFSCLIQGFLSLFALIRLTQISTGNPLTLILFAAVCFIYFQFTKNQVECRIHIKDQVCSIILSAIFSAITISIKYPVLVLNSGSIAENIITVVLTSLGLFLIYFYSLLWLFITCYETDINNNIYPVNSLPIITFFGSVIVFGIYYVVDFPGIIPVQTQMQFDEINGTTMFSDNISLIHTVLLDKLYKLIFFFTHNNTLCIAGLTAIQVLFIAFVAAYCIKTLQKAHIHSKLCILAALYFIIPYHALMAVTISSDTLFAACLGGFCSVLIRLFLKSDQKSYSKAKWFSIIAPYFIFGFLICTLSRNGLIVFIISLPFILLTLKEKWQAPLFTSIAVLLLVGFIKFPFMHLYNIEKRPFVDYVSPYLVSIFAHDSDVSNLVLLKQFFKESLPIIYPIGSYFSFAVQSGNDGLVMLPDIISSTVFTMHDFLPLYGLLFSSGIPFWITLISIFLCITNCRPENITFILPVFIFAITLGIMPPAELSITAFYPLFFIIPIIVFLPFIDAESEF